MLGGGGGGGGGGKGREMTGEEYAESLSLNQDKRQK